MTKILAALPAAHELGDRRKLVRGLLVSVCPLNCLFLREQNGAYTESISISPELKQICYISYAINCPLNQLPAMEADTAEYHQRASYLNHQVAN